MQSDLFADEPASCDGDAGIDLPLQDASMRYVEQFFAPSLADKIYANLLNNLAWRQDHIRLYGRDVRIPRLQAWYGDSEAAYQYSGLTMQPLPWTRELQWIRQQCEQYCQCRFNAVLANLYRDGADSMGFHADDEPELGQQPVIASISLGQERNLDFKHRFDKQKYRLPVQHGSLLVMSGDTQQYWHHGINKSKKTLQPRINLTFRKIYQL